MSARVLVAGVGNIFLGDDAFGVEVVRRLADQPLPEWVQVIDFGIGGVHLAYELLDGYDAAIIVDAMPRGDRPGTVYVMEPDRATPDETGTEQGLVVTGAITDAHAMEPGSVLQMVQALGVPTRVLVVGCEPAVLDERIGLSPVVDQAVDEGVQAVLSVLEEEVTVGSRQWASTTTSSSPEREEH